MPESLEEVKERLRKGFLGKGGIHGVGISQQQRAIRVYVHPHEGTEQVRMLDQIRQAAHPFPIVVSEEERPRLS
jgi:hypothetical protein